jgi:hypothetical protein
MAEPTEADREAARVAVAAFNAGLAEHEGCAWAQVGPCVYCTDHHVRLYQGELPERKRTVPVCAPEDHDWDMEMGQGFYSQCRTCGFMEWHE